MLRGVRPQMHLDAAFFIVRSNDVPEARKIEIRAEFAIDARQQIQIESSGYAKRIVVCQHQLRDRLFQIGAPAAARRLAAKSVESAQKIRRRGPVEIANRAAEK